MKWSRERGSLYDLTCLTFGSGFFFLFHFVLASSLSRMIPIGVSDRTSAAPRQQRERKRYPLAFPLRTSHHTTGAREFFDWVFSKYTSILHIGCVRFAEKRAHWAGRLTRVNDALSLGCLFHFNFFILDLFNLRTRGSLVIKGSHFQGQGYIEVGVSGCFAE
ncbi:hypothetical protein F4802DRAFT_315781 [Xylaria palmicola]|nr:hypothetical protein F4802DRAFT_315781 [Xylaria palmicola]